MKKVMVYNTYTDRLQRRYISLCTDGVNRKGLIL